MAFRYIVKLFVMAVWLISDDRHLAINEQAFRYVSHLALLFSCRSTTVIEHGLHSVARLPLSSNSSFLNLSGSAL